MHTATLLNVEGIVLNEKRQILYDSTHEVSKVVKDTRISVLQKEKFLEICCTMMQIYFISLNYILIKN